MAVHYRTNSYEKKIFIIIGILVVVSLSTLGYVLVNPIKSSRKYNGRKSSGLSLFHFNGSNQNQKNSCSQRNKTDLRGAFLQSGTTNSTNE